ncbi:hypothetical protein [Arenimonas sp.]|uniref:hypothetical protein n=1 Tax=Arenimonas sp. TaxID=1872635 RepID=UPI0039E432D8
MAYLEQAELFSELVRGGRVEQYAGPVTLSGVRGVRWLELRATLHGIELWVFDVQDVGAPGHADLYGFPRLDEDETPFAVATFDVSRKAVQYAQDQYGADPLRWARPGQAKAEYDEFLNQQRSPRWSSLGEPNDDADGSGSFGGT